MFQVCKSGQHSNPTAGPSSQVTQSCLPSIQLEQSHQGTPETRASHYFTQIENQSVSAKNELNQDQSSPLKQTQMPTDTARSKDEVASNRIANQSQNSSLTEPDRNQEPAKTKTKENGTSLEMVLKKQKHQKSVNSELIQLQDSSETKPAICHLFNKN